MNDEMLMAVSDKMKSKGRRDFQCHEKDKSIHALPCGISCIVLKQGYYSYCRKMIEQ